jgi:hypothetical protein
MQRRLLLSWLGEHQDHTLEGRDARAGRAGRGGRLPPATPPVKSAAAMPAELP